MVVASDWCINTKSECFSNGATHCATVKCYFDLKIVIVTIKVWGWLHFDSTDDCLIVLGSESRDCGRRVVWCLVLSVVVKIRIVAVVLAFVPFYRYRSGSRFKLLSVCIG